MNVNSFLKQVREGYTPSKAEETELIETLRDTFLHRDGSTYLYGLFSEELTRWVAAEIRQDTSCDIWAYLASAEKSERTLTNALAEKENEISGLGGTIALQADTLKQLQARITTLEEQRRDDFQLNEQALSLQSALYDLAMTRWLDEAPISPTELRDVLKQHES